MKKKLLLALGLASLALTNAVLAVGVADATITAGADNAEATFNYVKPIMIGIAVFLIGFGYFKRMRRA